MHLTHSRQKLHEMLENLVTNILKEWVMVEKQMFFNCLIIVQCFTQKRLLFNFLCNAPISQKFAILPNFSNLETYVVQPITF